MADKQRALNSLTLALQTCSAVTGSLDERKTPGSAPRSDQPALGVLHKDLVSLFSLIYGTVTKLAICLKPASPTYSACHTPLQELARNLVAVGANVAFYDPAAHGCALVQEVLLTALELVEAVAGLLRALIVTVRAPTGAEDGGEYLILTGTVHELVERARAPAPAGLACDNLDAVRKKWAEDRAVMEDAFKELDEMLVEEEEGGETQEDIGEDDVDDGWDELGLGMQKMSADERRRAKTVQPLLRFVTLLHKRILSDLLVPANSLSVDQLDSLVGFSSSLQVGMDEVIAALYPTQQPVAISVALKTLTTHVEALHTQVEPLLPPVVPVDIVIERLDAVSLNSSPASETPKASKNRDPAQWFRTCFAQIQKVSTTLQDDMAKEYTVEKS